MASGDYYLQKNNGTTIDEKIFTAVSGKAIGFDASLNPVMLDVSLAGHTHSGYLALTGGTMSNTTVVTNMNADLLDGLHGVSYIKENDVLMNTNPFGGRRLYINSIDNAMYAADKKWFVTLTTHLKTYNSETYPKLNPDYVAQYTTTGSGTVFTITNNPTPADITVYNNDTICTLSASPTTQYTYSYVGGVLTFGATVTGTLYVYPGPTITQYLDSPVEATETNPPIFDGSYESSYTIPIGFYAKIRITFNSTGTSNIPNALPYGTYFLSYYNTQGVESASVRQYSRNHRPHGIGWHINTFAINTQSFGPIAYNYIQSCTPSSDFGRTILEFIIVSHAAYSAKLAQIDWKLDRPVLDVTGSTVTKFAANKIYYDLQFGDQTLNKIVLSPTGTGYFAGQVSVAVSQGTAPFVIGSTTLCSNLNADLLDGNHASDFAAASHTHSYDNYVSWDVSANSGTASQIYKSGSASSYKGVNFVGSGTVSISTNSNANGFINVNIVGSAGYTHPSYTAFNPTLSGATVLASLTTNTIGAVTAVTTRTLTLANLGYTGATNATYFTGHTIYLNGTSLVTIGSGGYLNVVATNAAGDPVVTLTGNAGAYRYDISVSGIPNCTLTGYTAGSTGLVAATDSLKVAFSKLQYQMPKTVYTNISDVLLVGSTPNDFYSYTLPANTLSSDNQRLELVYSGSNAANTNGKSIQFYFGGTSYINISNSSTTSLNWYLNIIIVRASSSTLRVSFNGNWYTFGSGNPWGTGINFATTNIIKLVAQGGASSDITGKLCTITHFTS